MACNVSGVVIRISGGLLDWRTRSLVSVSPCLTANLMSRLLHHHSSRSSMSRFKARNGVIYRTFMPGTPCCPCRSMLKTGRKAASVLPVAVGEIRRTFLPSRILGMVFSCGSDGFGNPLCSTSLRTGLTSSPKAFSEESFTTS